jgi:hypothetical protein
VSRAGLEPGQGAENTQVIENANGDVRLILSIRSFIVENPVQAPFRSSSIGPTFAEGWLRRAIPNTVRWANVSKVNNDTIRFELRRNPGEPTRTAQQGIPGNDPRHQAWSDEDAVISARLRMEEK